MPGRLRQSAGQSSEVTQQTGTYNITGLDFNDALTWRAGKAIAVADLLTRLKKLGAELRNLDQGQIAAGEFTRLAQDLAHSNLLGHKDKGVRAWVLCCIVDILNICAPDAPFVPAQLKDIFTVVVNTIIPALADPSNVYNAQHVYILDSLTDTKSIVLITDLENADSLIIPLFTICFDIVSGAAQKSGVLELAKSVEFQLRSMLVTIIDEANLPQEVTDIILSQFLRVDPRTSQDHSSKNKKATEVKDRKQDTLHLKDYPPAYNMAKSICTTCPEKMTVHVTQYFGNIIMNASASLEDNSDTKRIGRKVTEPDSDEDDESLADLRKAHRLVRELWRACPDVLLNVIPQIETELAADSVALRQLATETLGDIIAGIGISGPPPTASLDPAAYPLPSVEEPEAAPLTTNPLLVPASPKPFGSVHSSTFQSFLGRRIDKSPLVRGVWAVAISRILLTDAGGIGISDEDRERMLVGYAQVMRDPDDKVRLLAVQSVAQFDYHSIIKILGSDGGMSSSDTVLSTLADRISDRKSSIREDAMMTLGRIWGVASRDVENGVERVVTSVDDIPSRLLSAMTLNDAYTQTLVYKVTYECLIPLGFPPVKSSKSDSQKQRGKDKQSSTQHVVSDDPDLIRVRRLLTLLRGLNTRARQIFLLMQKQQVVIGRAIKGFLQACENYNGGVVDDNTDEGALKATLTKYIQQFSKQFSDPARVVSDLWKFAKMHDRRNYQLIKFAIGAEHDYRTMSKAIKELVKRLREGPTSSQSLTETILPLLYRCALVVYNRSHVPAIMTISRGDDADFADIAHDLLKEVSAQNPEVLKSHIQVLCKELEEAAPSASSHESSSAAETLKACADFARRYPADVPNDRKFLTSLINYALLSHSPKAAKHAVTILLTVSDKKELHAKELMTKAVKDCKSSQPQYRARLATIAQVCLLAPEASAAEEDSILRIAVVDCLQKNKPSFDNNSDDKSWEDVPSEEFIAKELALKIMVNRCRSADETENHDSFDALAQSVFNLLMRFVREDGEIAPSQDTPLSQRNRLRLVAVQYILKLCRHKQRCEELLTPIMFNEVALVVINPPFPVRDGFVRQLKKYLVRTNLHSKWYTVLFLLAFEPDVKLRTETLTWLKSRVSFFARQQQAAVRGSKSANTNVMETTLARLLSILAHHPDYPKKEVDNYDGDLLDFARYIIMYLQAVATEENLSLIFYIAQKVKQTKDNITGNEDVSENLYVLSDLAQAVIQHYANLMPAHARGINLLQTWPGRATLSNQLFANLPSSDIAQRIATKNYLPEEVAIGLERLVRLTVKGGKGGGSHARRVASERKRRSSDVFDSDDEEAAERKRSVKKAKKASLPIRRTPKVKRKNDHTSFSPEQPSRKSVRVSTGSAVNYAESDDEDDDEEMMDAPAASSPLARTTKPSAKKTGKSRESVPDPIIEEEGRVESDAEQAAEETDDASPKPTTHINGDDEKENEGLEDVTAEDSEGNGEEDREGTPSPLREHKNGRTTKTKPKSSKTGSKTKQSAKAKSGPSSKAKQQTKSKVSSPVADTISTTRRSTRRSKG